MAWKSPLFVFSARRIPHRAQHSLAKLVPSRSSLPFSAAFHPQALTAGLAPIASRLRTNNLTVSESTPLRLSSSSTGAKVSIGEEILNAHRKHTHLDCGCCSCGKPLSKIISLSYYNLASPAYPQPKINWHVLKAIEAYGKELGKNHVDYRFDYRAHSRWAFEVEFAGRELSYREIRELTWHVANVWRVEEVEAEANGIGIRPETTTNDLELADDFADPLAEPRTMWPSALEPQRHWRQQMMARNGLERSFQSRRWMSTNTSCTRRTVLCVNVLFHSQSDFLRKISREYVLNKFCKVTGKMPRTYSHCAYCSWALFFDFPQPPSKTEVIEFLSEMNGAGGVKAMKLLYDRCIMPDLGPEVFDVVIELRNEVEPPEDSLIEIMQRIFEGDVPDGLEASEKDKDGRPQRADTSRRYPRGTNRQRKDR